MNFVIIFACLSVLIINIALGVKVTVYYEALCSDSVNFISQQLFPTYKHLKNYMQLELVPYGKATHYLSDNRWIFECQHGVRECRGNKYQSCALAQNNTEEMDLSFVNCVMRLWNPSEIGGMENCSIKVGINWKEIYSCANSDLGDDFLALNGNKTHSLDPSISFVPTIIINEQYDDYLQYKSLTHFGAVVCSKINETKPKFCDDKDLPKQRQFWDYFSVGY